MAVYAILNIDSIILSLNNKNMKKVIIFIVVILLIGGGFYFYDQRNKQAVAPGNENDSQVSSGNEASDNPAPPPPAPTPTPPAPAPSPSPSTGTFSSGDESMGPDIAVFEVAYDGKAYSPKTTDIKVGDIVIFRNKSTGSFWPASAPHPSHTDYPELDAKKAITAGGKFEFTFDKAGNWRFHDHLNPTAFGSINVTAK
jgi:plastocyanin